MQRHVTYVGAGHVIDGLIDGYPNEAYSYAEAQNAASCGPTAKTLMAAVKQKATPLGRCSSNIQRATDDFLRMSPQLGIGEAPSMRAYGAETALVRLSVLASPFQQFIWSAAMVRDHQLGEDVFRSILPEDIDWKPFSAFPPSARLAVLVGEPTQGGPYLIRVKIPSGVKLMPHKHPEDRIYTVISGVFYIGLGARFEPEDLKAYPPGSVVVLPGDTWHFHWAKSGEYVTQVTAIGPLGLEYKEAADDPRTTPPRND